MIVLWALLRNEEERKVSFVEHSLYVYKYQLIFHSIWQMRWPKCRGKGTWLGSHTQGTVGTPVSITQSHLFLPPYLCLIKFHSSHLIKSPWKLTLDFYVPKQNDKWLKGGRNHLLIIFKAIDAHKWLSGGSNSALRGQSKFRLKTINNNNNKIEKAGTMWKRLVRALTQSKVYIRWGKLILYIHFFY